MLVCRLLLFDLLVWSVGGSSIIAGLQTKPPAVKFGVNRDAFDEKTLGEVLNLVKL